MEIRFWAHLNIFIHTFSNIQQMLELHKLYHWCFLTCFEYSKLFKGWLVEVGQGKENLKSCPFTLWQESHKSCMKAPQIELPTVSLTEGNSPNRTEQWCSRHSVTQPIHWERGICAQMWCPRAQDDPYFSQLFVNWQQLRQECSGDSHCLCCSLTHRKVHIF